MRSGRWLVGSLAVLLLAATAACTAAAKETPSPFADCSALPTAAVSNDLPDLSIPCFTGAKPVALKDLRGPAVINLWASWCGPCRAELPLVQGLAERTRGRLTVLGVDVQDGREAGASFAAAKNISLPTLFDQDSKVLNALTGASLPITAFVDAGGRTYVFRGALTEQTIAEQVRAHTGVTVTP